MAKKNTVSEEIAETTAAAPVTTTEVPEKEPAEKKPAAKRGRKPAAAKADETKTEEKKPAAKRGRKPAAAKADETKTEEKKPAAKRGRKPAAAKADEAKKAEKKPAAKRGRKPAAEKAAPAKAEKTAAAKAEKKPAAKRGRKPAAEKAAPAAKKTSKKKGISYDDVFDAAKKKFLAADITKIKYPVAANVELSGSVTGDFYIFIDVDNQTIAVEPYRYNDYDVNFRADADELLAVMNGKKNIYDALAGGLIKVNGITTKAILLVNAAF